MNVTDRCPDNLKTETNNSGTGQLFILKIFMMNYSVLVLHDDRQLELKFYVVCIVSLFLFGSISSWNCEHKIKMLYLHNTSQEMPKFATYAAKSFQLLGASPPDPPTRGSAPGPRWGHSPQTHSIPSVSANPPKDRVSG